MNTVVCILSAKHDGSRFLPLRPFVRDHHGAAQHDEEIESVPRVVEIRPLQGNDLAIRFGNRGQDAQRRENEGHSVWKASERARRTNKITLRF